MSAAKTLVQILNRDVLRMLADGRSFERGENYWLDGWVRSITWDGGRVIAKVIGTDDYRVELWVEDDELEYSCTCPVNDDGSFCKHCVAVGLKLLAEKKHLNVKVEQSGVTMDDVRIYLGGLAKEALVEVIIRQAKDDDNLRDRLLMKAAGHRDAGIDLSAFRNALHNAVDTGGYIHYREMYAYTQGIHRVIDSIDELLDEGHASEVIELIESALEMVEEAARGVDDSDGEMGGIFCRLQEMHLAACEQAKPDPEELVRRLFKWEMDSDYDIFMGAAEDYASVLGEKGLAVYRQLAEDEWSKIRPLSPGEEDDEKYGRRFRITKMMESLASQSGDIETQVQVMSRDLSMAYDFLQIAKLYESNGLRDKSLEWAEKGVAAFPCKTDSRLREFLAEEYHRRGRHDDAMALIWAEFQESPMLSNYKQLKTHADRSQKWAVWRDKALQLLRDELEKEKLESRKDRYWYHQPDASTLVEIFLWEKDAERAWEEAKRDGCHDDLWLKLAAIREKSHPEDALGVYKPYVEPAIEHGNYEGAVSFLGKVRELLLALSREEEFADYLLHIRITWKRKRNMMKLLAAAKWD
jgi:uncharacterized Zn finger protein